ncbi:BamA/TamA family outer membrane protein [Vibrio sp. HENC-03]|uniref:BamA/TamA family outer membrane protein n=1 Tax=Vibrio sp. HENC-03 TaxID=992012 RepID=UPI000517FFD1|nr:BamA/TamA family outer membrane protein [Vibrio sp. HENC-03]
MKKPTSVLLTSTYFGLLATSPIAEAISFFDPIDGQLDMGEYLAENAYGFLPVPIVITEPAVGYGLGFTGVFLHESDEQREKRRKLAETSLNGGAQLLTPAITAVGGFATENGTWMGFAGHRRTWAQDTVRYLGGVGYGDFNMTFYPQSTLPGLDGVFNGQGLDFEITGGGMLNHLQYRIIDAPLFIGVKQLYFVTDQKITNSPVADKLLQTLTNTSPTTSGLGLTLEWDSRNNFFSPTLGYNYKAEFLWYNDAFGSDYEYEQLDVEGINYWELAEDWSLALRGQYKSLYTEERFLPPASYPDIELRGVARNRYQGDETLSVETQLTYQWNTRWSTNVFGGFGYASTEESLFENDAEYAYGVGFRYLIARRYGLQAGMDFAFSDEDSAVYFQVGSGI